MKEMVLAGIVALSASTSLAQTSTAPEPTAPATETATPAAAQASGPANLCQELLAFMKAPAEVATPTAAAPAQQPGTSTSSTAAPAKPETGTGSAQKITGQSGVATDSPQPNKEKVASGSATNAPQKESRAAPLPPSDTSSTPKDSVINVAKAEELAAAKDIAQFQKTARQMRVAGVAMPPPLLALAALDLKYQQKSGEAPQLSGSGNPPATGQGPAQQTQAPQ
ncbi:MAG: hypothetical protein EOR32_23350 [Mesorhizobium sp.]|uniref:hypothetical protein n=1 Tax=Mesorhizobium sp. TaxID=1871066 RepID=UPI000FEA94A4|nr:hypothetical protein [Mesorhizobium sp.]RWJ59190.1 MAG: hypothetical protein EOR32_23350 [Mesorhizobium sp.]